MYVMHPFCESFYKIIFFSLFLKNQILSFETILDNTHILILPCPAQLWAVLSAGPHCHPQPQLNF